MLKRTPLALAVLLATAIPNAQADFQGDVLRSSLNRRAHPVTDVGGIPVKADLADLHHGQALSDDELGQIEKALLGTYGRDRRVRRALPSMLVKLREAHASGRSSAVFFYLGVDVGVGVGFSGNVGLFFGRDEAGRVGVFPVTISRLNFLELGLDLHVGIGFIRDDLRTLSGGVHIGGAWVVGGGMGIGDSRAGGEFWVEFKVGAGVQVGYYLEVIH